LPSPVWSAEDEHQECLLRLLRSPPRDPHALRSAYRTTLRNLRVDHARATARAPQVSLEGRELADAHQQDPSQSAESLEEAAQLRVALSELKPDERELLHLRFFQGWDVSEIARQLGVTPACARKRLARTIELLRARLRV
jgi:RNA polymerase sigma factor (sigma-70 family)